MKKLLLISLGFLPLFSCKKDKEPAAPEKTIIGKRQFSNKVLDAIKTVEGDIVVLGRDNVTEGAWIARYSVYGEQLWSKKFDKDEILTPTCIAEVPGEGFMIVSEGELMGHKYYQVCVTKISTSGDVIWKKDYGIDENETAFEIIRTHDNKFLIAGYISLQVSNDICLVKIDKDGNQLFVKHYPGADYQFPNAVIETADHSYVLTGESSSITIDKMYVMKVSENGDKIWDHTLPYPGGETVGRDIIELPDGSLAVCGEQYKTGETEWQAFIAKFTSAGTLTWKKEYGDAATGEIATSIVSDGSDGFMMSGRQQRTDLNIWTSHMYYSGINPSGEQTWKHTINSQTGEAILESFRLPGGEYMMIGTGYLSGTSAYIHYLVGINANGEM